MSPTNSPATSQGHGAQHRKVPAGGGATGRASARPAWVILLALLVVGIDLYIAAVVWPDVAGSALFVGMAVVSLLYVMSEREVCRCPRKDGGR